MLEEQDDHQHENCQQQVFHRAKVLCTVAAAERVDADGDQRQADGQHDRAGNDRGEQLAQRLEEDAEDALKDAAQNGRAHNGTIGHDAAAHGSRHTVEHAQEA